MYIESISFSKIPIKGEGWSIENCNLNKINLIAGKNSSGKTRLLLSIYTLAEILNDEEGYLNNGYSYYWDIKLISDNLDEINYILKMKNNDIIEERLLKNNIEYFSRNKNGKGEITYESLKNKKIEFEIEKNKIALKAKRDKKQHPSLEAIFLWINSIYFYKFGDKLGRNYALSPKMIMDEKLIKDASKDDDAVVIKFKHGLEKGGEEFRNNVIKDINSIGYNITDIKLNYEDKKVSQNKLLMLYIKEEDLADKIFQNEISQGMFRVISLIIQIRYLKHDTDGSPCILIDDIGEGLDYERSTKLINYIIKQAEIFKDHMQLIMTTNDRFVMNAIDLDYWTIIDKNKSKVNFYNNKNSPNFANFRKIGLNNFDFFSSEYYKSKI